MNDREIEQAKRDGRQTAWNRAHARREKRREYLGNARQRAILFFAEWGDTIRGERMLTAKALADAEGEAEWLGLRVDWEPEDLDPADSFDYEAMGMTREDLYAKFESGEWTWEYAVVRFPSGARGASLGGISLGGSNKDKQRRVFEAQLYLETLGPVRYSDLYRVDDGSACGAD